MKPCRQIPAENVRDWRQVEHCIHDILAFTGADGAAIVAITSRMKILRSLQSGLRERA